MDRHAIRFKSTKGIISYQNSTSTQLPSCSLRNTIHTKRTKLSVGTMQVSVRIPARPLHRDEGQIVFTGTIICLSIPLQWHYDSNSFTKLGEVFTTTTG